MKLETPYKCDGCGKQKGPGSPWWVRITDIPEMFSVRPWHATIADEAAIEHYCGQECLSKAFTKWMATFA
jgi:hypothetical protein